MADEAPPGKKWPSHNYDAARVDRPEPAKWLHSLEPKEESTPEQAWKRGEVLQRAYPQLTRKPAAKPAPIPAEEQARLEARFAETRRRRRMLVRIALLMLWGAMFATVAVVYFAST